MSRGGSRYGAGRPGWRRKIEQCLRLDVRDLARRGVLKPGAWKTWRWISSYTGEETGSIAIRGESGRIVLDYQANGEPVKFPVLLTRTRCHFGGARPWFVCAQCGRRCGVVAYARGTWACRICLNLAYLSESEDTIGRLWRKQRKLEAMLGEDWSRLKRMRISTHERIVGCLLEVERRKDEWALAIALSHIGADREVRLA